MKFWHNTVGLSWGFSIIALTAVIRLLILPLTFKQVRSMQQLQRLQPEMKKLQERFKEDRQRLNEEMMKFYKEHKVNPAGACLPVLLQLPFFLALFYMLRKDLRIDICGQSAKSCGDVPGAPDPGFLFIPDITNRATGAVLVTLLVLYVGSQLISGLITTFTADRNQRIMMLALPFLFVGFIFNFDAGLILYWITTNVWTIGQQLLIKKFLPAPEPLVLAEAGGGDGKPARGKAPSQAKPQKPASAGNGDDAAASPPPPPRKKKKRSGRRR
jgi:YidC/Oxa1 family membrane protein insertase